MEEKFPSSKREIVQLKVNVNELTYAALIACLRILLYLLMFPYNHQHISRQQLYRETQIWWHFGCYTNILNTNIPIMIDTLNEDFISSLWGSERSRLHFHSSHIYASIYRLEYINKYDR